MSVRRVWETVWGLGNCLGNVCLGNVCLGNCLGNCLLLSVEDSLFSLHSRIQLNLFTLQDLTVFSYKFYVCFTSERIFFLGHFKCLLLRQL